MALALRDPSFFDDGDAIIELDGSEVLVHSALLCQRCPFFDGLFNGRAGGQWLSERRQNNSEAVRIDLKHVQPEAFNLVLRYLYSDIGNELFDDIVSTDIDEFSELVMDVLAVSDELMLDRLSQICQQVIGRFGEWNFGRRIIRLKLIMSSEHPQRLQFTQRHWSLCCHSFQR